MVLTLEERETIINFNEAEDDASIFTYNRRWQRHLEQTFGLVPVLDNGAGGKEYMIGKDRIRLPRLPKKLTPEAKASQGERGRKALAALHGSKK